MNHTLRELAALAAGALIGAAAVNVHAWEQTRRAEVRQIQADLDRLVAKEAVRDGTATVSSAVDPPPALTPVAPEVTRRDSLDRRHGP